MRNKFVYVMMMLVGLTITSCLIIQRKLHAEQSKLKLSTDSLARMKEVLSDFIQNSSLKINLGKYSFIDKVRDTIHNIQQLFESDKFKLVLFLSDKQCVECQINAFKSIPDGFDLSKILIISRYNNFTQAKLLIANINLSINVNIVNALSDIFPDYIETSNTPYFFLLDHNLDILSLIKHDTYMPVITTIYINSLEQYLYTISKSDIRRS